MTAWIKMISDEEADPTLLEVLDRARTPHGTVDNVMRVHSLRPHTMDGHVALYKAALHNDGNSLPLWFLELVGSYTSLLNRCEYSYTNHIANFRVQLGDDKRADAIVDAIHDRAPERVLDGAELALMQYTEKLTLHPGDMVQEDVDRLREAGAGDGEILEVNQVCGYFSYANRLLNGLGVTLAGDVIGYYKSADD